MRTILGQLSRCSGCQESVVSSFIRAFGVSVRPSRDPWIARRPYKTNYLGARFSSSGPHFASDPRTDVFSNDLSDTTQSDEKTAEIEGQEVPWYLQVDPPSEALNPLLERQKLPDLPHDPPPLLKPILEHISIGLGLDDLELLDLRHIDPPPALGANLLMIVGTARSEKHLHVSADRFCRWLKVEHKLKPYADGLLGRGELKLKLRRKAKRARLLSKVGSADTSTADDGIRTGWICVNIGSILAGKTGAIQQDLQDDYVGFGQETGGASLVVQMLTSEKREELALESLWGGVISRFERKEARIENQPEVRAEPSGMAISFKSTTQSYNDAHGQRQILYQGQSRAYSTSQDNIRMDDHDSNKSPQARSITGESDSPGTTSMTQGGPALESSYGETSANTLQSLYRTLQSWPIDRARSLLGDKQSVFWQDFEAAYPLFPSVNDAECHLRILSYSLQIGTGSSKEDVIALIHHIKANYIYVPGTLYNVALQALLGYAMDGTQFHNLECTSTDLLEVVELLEDMDVRDNRLDSSTIQDLLGRAILCIENDIDTKPRVRIDAFSRLQKMLNVEPGPEEAFLHANIADLYRCAAAAKWNLFWYVWRGFARAMRPRPKQAYIAMFECVARHGHQAKTMQALRDTVPLMEYEEPPVLMDASIAKAIQKCLRVAEPGIETIAAQPDAYGEWLDLWRRCQSVIIKENHTSEALMHAPG